MKHNHRETLLLLGLGGDEVVHRQVAFVDWLNKRRPADAQIHVFETLWQTDEGYKDKWSRLLDYVTENAGIKVVYAISAGASLGMSLVPILPPETEYHLISGKLRRANTIGPERRQRAPAFYESVVASEEVISSTDLTQYNMTCHTGFIDGILAQQDMRVDNVPIKRIPMINHSMAIALAYLTTLRKL